MLSNLDYLSENPSMVLDFILSFNEHVKYNCNKVYRTSTKAAANSS